MPTPASPWTGTATAPGRRRREGLAVALTLLAVLALAAPAAAQVEDKALGRPATASSVEQARPGGQCDETRCAPGMATDGNPDTRWESEYLDTEWWQVDLGRPRQVDQVSLLWHLARAESYVISTSLDGVTFTTAADVRLDLSPEELADVIRTRRHREATTFAARAARYVRVTGRRRALIQVGNGTRVFGISFWEANVFGPADAAPAGATGQPAAPSRPGSGFDLPSAPAAPPAPGPAAPPAGAPRQTPTLAPFPIIRITGSLTGSGARIRLLSVRAPRAATVRITCRGRGCPSRVRSRKGGSTRRIRELHRALGAGTVIQVAVTQRGRYGKHTRFVIRRNGAPRRIDRCTLGTSTRPVACPTG